MIVTHSYSFGSGRITSRLSYPDILVRGVFADGLKSRMRRVLDNSARRMKRSFISGYRDVDGPVKDSFHQEIYNKPSGPGLAVYSTDKIFPYIEFDTKPHMPPTWYQGRLYKWVGRKFGNPRPLYKHLTITYGVALSIAEFGTEGRYIMQHAFEEEAPKLEATLEALVTEMLMTGRSDII